MLPIELTCAVIVAVYCRARIVAAGADRAAVIARLASLAVAAWVGEDSVIRAYGFYAYAPGWSVFVDRVPLLIVAIWPVVIDSAHVLARRLVSGVSRTAIAGGLIVLADAALIEPIAVHARLWTWSPENARALFEVPLVGVLGWAFFAAAAIATLELFERRGSPAGWDTATIVLAPLGAHAALLVSWWCVFRWMSGDLSPWSPALFAWLLFLPVGLAAWRFGTKVPVRAVLMRAPGAAFFFALLAATSTDRRDLVVYALAFAPPYLALVVRSVELERKRARGFSVEEPM